MYILYFLISIFTARRTELKSAVLAIVEMCVRHILEICQNGET